jgi:hypothetical protein
MRYLIVALSAVVLYGQSTPAVMQNAGKPIAVQARCTAEMIHDLGLPCSVDHPCPIHLDLSDIQAVGNRLVLAGNLHTSSTTLESILLTSDDTGKTWVEAHARIPMAILDHIQFYDFEAGWINGHLLQAIPRDAFFLLTSDGGKTWRRRPIFGESRPGAIEFFFFDSRTRGQLLIERPFAEDGIKHELWESQTGGESWNVRQVDSKPIPLTRPPRTSAWRIRSDAKTQSHRIEREAGPKWEAVASFVITPGECKPPPPPPEADPSKETLAPEPESPPPPKPPPSKRSPTLKPKRTR